ncbi:group II intron reverse transcriptase/maturase [Thiocapsa bogorovii]|uniref:group II intron reverse transcriptase/maturase n=1 Tax=Thiocapsa bogorovii TaxID=521689 RepID=UPI001E2E8EAD|nr:group II intron reverse transcriptase/maturase [Thiocapsa bogorovii]UHD15457.1 group II intron reverse transcriptase/maturase [Thiocapsa bogorovii]
MSTESRRLGEKARNDPRLVFSSLHHHVCDVDHLRACFEALPADRAVGIDGITKERYGANLEENLEALSSRLRNMGYRPQPKRRTYIPKPGSEKGRPLAISCFEDKLVELAIKRVLEPIYEVQFEDRSYGYRPGRSQHRCLDDLGRTIQQRRINYIVEADIRSFFDTIPHAKLMAVVAERIVDGPVLGLIRQWLKAPVIEEDEQGKRRPTGGKGNRRGTPQGGVASPLLANLYLHLLDRIWVRHDLERRLGARLVRYADDAVILCRHGTKKPMAVFTAVLEKLDLTLNVQKTHVVDARADGFDFLGFRIAWRTSRRSGKGYPHVEPSKRAEQRIKDRVTELTARRRTPVALRDMIGEVNHALRGWSGYFHYRNCSTVLGRVKTHAEERMRTQLRRRHKLQSRAQGYLRFPNAHVYDHLGLFKIPTTAGWTSAHASA